MTVPVFAKLKSKSYFSARIFPRSAFERLSVHLVPHVLDVQLLLPLPEVVALLDAAAWRRRSSVRIVQGAGERKPTRDETAEERAHNELRHGVFPSC